MHFSLEELILTTGYIGITIIVFAESGLFIGFFLPGDSLMITAGLLASRGYLQLEYLLPLAIIAAIAGDSVGYWFGKKVGHKIFSREDSILFHKRNLIKANEFYAKHGGKTIVLARFMPFIRTFAPIVAGVGEMHYAKFLSFNIFGGIFWVLATTLGGYYLGRIIPGIDRYFIVIVGIVVIVSAIPGLLHFWKEYREPILQKVRERLAKKRD